MLESFNKSHYFFAIPIAVLLTIFNYKTIDIINNKSKIDTLCSNVDEHDKNECYKIREKKLDSIKTKKFMYMLIAGLVCIMASYKINHEPTKSSIILGGVMTILIAEIFYWNNMNELMKLGATLAALIYASFKFF
jgi:predicted histidine transporter YuiF (NhaC family)